MTMIMEMSVPRPSVFPNEAITPLEVMPPIRNPAQVKMLPEVTMVGNAWFKDSTTAFSSESMVFLSSTYLVVMTMA